MIDWERVADLKAEVGVDGFDEVIALFLEETDEVVARLPASGDALQVGRDLHFLKGSALNLGFREMAQLCQDGERKIALGAVEEVDLRALAALYRKSKAAFHAALAKTDAA
nr:Hpt domain-containing protein [Gemmobacter aquatilis]